MDPIGVADLIRNTLEMVRDLHDTDTGCCVEEDIGEALNGAEMRSYEEAQILTRDGGFVLELPDGSEFQVTVVRSR
jgi:hypothetical protein